MPAYTLHLPLLEGQPFSLSDTVQQAQIWAASTAFTAGTIVPNPANGYFYTTAASGTSSATQPTWPINPGLTVTDNNITWTCQTNPVYYNLDFSGCTATAKFREFVNSATSLLTLTEVAGISLGATAGTIGIDITTAQITTLVGTTTQGVWDLIVTFPGPLPVKLFGGHWTIERSNTR